MMMIAMMKIAMMILWAWLTRQPARGDCETSPPRRYDDGDGDVVALTRGGRCIEVEGVDDAADFEELVEAIRGMGISQDGEASIMSTLAGILHLGDMCFTSAKDGSGRLEGGESVGLACSLLGIDAEDMRRAMCSRSIKAGLDTLSVPKSRLLDHNLLLDLFLDQVLDQVISY